MNRILPILISLLIGICGFTTIIPAVASAQINQDQLENSDNRWIIDSEVTSIGKNASRSGLLLDWALRDYNWSYTNPGTTHPLLPFWTTLRNLVYALMIGVVVIAAIVMLVTRGRSLAVRRFFPRLLLVAILVTFSFSIVQVLYELVDIFQGFFVRPGGVSISQKDLLFIGWNYQPFVGLRLLGDANFESAFTTLMFVKLTTFTYYVMVGILLIRKIILWFFIIISPFFPLLLFFYPLRNTAKIWIGEFFRWLLYAPLFAIFLAALVSLWKIGIPLSFNFGAVGAASAIIFPTAVSILLGGPGQAVGQLNNLNIIDTYAQYMVALMMLWGVIIIPWILLQIFLDYVSSLNVQNSPFFKSFSSYLNKVPVFPPPSTPPIPPEPSEGGSGRARSIPLIKDFQIPRSAGLAKSIPTSTNVNVSQMTNISIPTLLDIARYESQSVRTSESTRTESQRLKETLTKLANPANIKTENERSEFRSMRDTLRTQSLKGDKVAASILHAANTYSKTQQTSSQKTNITTILNELVNPDTVSDEKTRTELVSLKERIQKDVQSGNPLAQTLVRSTASNTQNITHVLSQLANPSHDTDTYEKTETLKETIERESKEGNTLATTILSTIKSIRDQTQVIQSLTRIIHPSDVPDTSQRQEYSKLQNALISEKETGSQFASFLTEKLERLTKETNFQEKEKIVSEISESVLKEEKSGNPLAALIRNQIHNLSDFKAETSVRNVSAKLEQAKKEGNPLAIELLSLAQKKELSDKEAKDIEEKVNIAKQNGDPLGVLLSDLLKRRQQALEKEAVPTALPTTNRIQQVSLDDYEAVKKMWTENYEHLEVPGVEGVSAKEAWIKDDMSQISQTIDLLSSQDQEKVQEGMGKVSDILPFLLIGGFSQGEIIAYMKAKLEAAKGVLTQIKKLDNDEDTKVSIKRQKGETPKHMEAFHEAEVPSFTPTDMTSEEAPPVVSQVQSPRINTASQTSESLLRLASIPVPSLRNIAQYDRMFLSKADEQNQDIHLMRETLQGIANPTSGETSQKREYYSQIRNQLLNEQASGNLSASSVLAGALEISTKKLRDDIRRYSHISSLLTLLQSGSGIDQSETAEIKKLRERISFEATRGSEFARELEKMISDPSVLSDPLQKTALISEITSLPNNGDPLAESLVILSEHTETAQSKTYAKSLEGSLSFLTAFNESRYLSENEKSLVTQITSRIEDLAKNGDEHGLFLAQLLKETKTNGIDITSIMKVENYLSTHEESLKHLLPQLGTFVTSQDSRSASLPKVLTTLTKPIQSKESEDLKKLHAEVQKTKHDPFVQKLLDWSRTLSDDQIDEILKILKVIDQPDSITDNKTHETCKTLRSELEKDVTSNSFAKGFLSLAKGVSHGVLSPTDIQTLMPTLVRRTFSEAVSGNKVALDLQNFVFKQLEEERDQSVFRRLLTSLSDPSHLPEKKKTKIMELRSLVVSEKEQGNPLASAVTDTLNKLLRKDSQTDSDIVKVLFLEVLKQEKQGNKLAEALANEIKQQNEEEKLLDLGEVLKALSDIKSLPEIERDQYQVVLTNLETQSSKGDSQAMSILSAIEIIQKQGVDLGEVRKVAGMMTSGSATYLEGLSQLVHTSLLSQSALGYLQDVVDALAHDRQDVSHLKEMGTKENSQVSKELMAIVKQYGDSLSGDKIHERLRMFRDTLLTEDANGNKFASEIVHFLAKRKQEEAQKLLFAVFENMANPDSIQLPEQRESTHTLVTLMESSSSSDQFARVISAVVKAIRNKPLGNERTDMLSLITDYVQKEADIGNMLAVRILEHVSGTSYEHEETMREQIKQESKNGNPVAKLLSELLQTEKGDISQVVLPSENTIQQVSLEDYESIKRMWLEGYKKLDVPGSQRTREEWLGDEVEHISQTISLLTSTYAIERKEGMSAVTNILPFLLIGGFTQTEVISYLKAKLEAARSVLGQLEDNTKEEESLLPKAGEKHNNQESLQAKINR